MFQKKAHELRRCADEGRVPHAEAVEIQVCEGAGGRTKMWRKERGKGEGRERNGRGKEKPPGGTCGWGAARDRQRDGVLDYVAFVTLDYDADAVFTDVGGVWTDGVAALNDTVLDVSVVTNVNIV